MITRLKIPLLVALLLLLVPLTDSLVAARPLNALALPEGRTYDQAHDAGFLDWAGNVKYVLLTHKDGATLPPEEGGGSCGQGCQEQVTRLRNGSSVSGAFQRDAAYFEVMVAFTHDTGVGEALLSACSASTRYVLYTGPGYSLPGFASMPLTVPAGCRTWTLSASGGYVDFRSVDVAYLAAPPTATPTQTSVPTLTNTATLTQTATPSHTPTSTATNTLTPSSTGTATVTATAYPTATWTSTPSPAHTATYTPVPPSTQTATLPATPSRTPAGTPTAPPLPPAVSLTGHWWIWESGLLHVTPKTYPIASVKLTISDPQNRWPRVTLEIDPRKQSAAVVWERRFADGTLAPSGEYPVQVRVCDDHNLCASAAGRISIPDGVWPTMTPAFTPTTTSTALPSATATKTHLPASPTPVLVVSTPTPGAPASPSAQWPLWQILGVAGWMIVIASASLVDPRPAALRRLGEALEQISNRNRIDSSQDEN